MRIICEDNVAAIVCSNALTRSPLLADMHQVDADGWVPVPCRAKTWTAWLTDDPPGLSPDVAELMLDVMLDVKGTACVHKNVGCFHVRLEPDPHGTAYGGVRQRYYLRQN
jgi:hypothetical protein